MNKKRIKRTIIIMGLFSLIPAAVFAADLSFGASRSAVAPDEDFLVGIFLDPAGPLVNVVGGSVSFPPGILELKEIRDADSAVSFWITEPRATSTGSVAFAGIAAGGFPKAKNPLFSVVFRAKSAGKAELAFQGAQVLQNDGLGTKAPLSARPLEISVAEGNRASSTDMSVNDSDPPEDFQPRIASDPSLYAGKYFLVFSAKDKGSGIGHYEVREGDIGDFAAAESPYLIKDQSLSQKIYVKAVDRSGNEKTAVVEAQGSIAGHLWTSLFTYSAIISPMMNMWYNGGSWGFAPLGIVGLGFIGATLFFLIMVAVIVLKGYALWHAARRSEKWWFIALLIVNTVGILELVYLYFVVGKWHKFTSGDKTS